MFDPKTLDDLARRLSETLPPGMRELQQETEKNFRTVMQSTLNHLELVTREEFDVQSAVLLRTREKLEAMEARLAELEAQLAEKNDTAE